MGAFIQSCFDLAASRCQVAHLGADLRSCST